MACCQDLKKKDRSCLPLVENDYCSPYELRQCFPCLTNPVSYFIVDRFPFVQWLSRYSLSCLISDIIAGLTVGLMVVPQALAYASIAQLPLQVQRQVQKYFLLHSSCSMAFTQPSWDVSCTRYSGQLRTSHWVRLQ